MNKPKIPLEKIGEKDWVNKLQTFLEEYDVEFKELGNFKCQFKLPDDLTKYYQFFGGTDSSDFMYQLYKPEDIIALKDSKWEFVKDSFPDEQIIDFIVFTESPSNDPVCINLKDFSIHIFSHDPIGQHKVFCDFNQYLKYELVELQKLMGDIEFDRDEELEYHSKHLSCDDINYVLRIQKFC